MLCLCEYNKLIIVIDNIQTTYISSLSLNNFRNYDHINLRTSGKPVVLFGENGSGKTNILEAISLLSPGKGLRKIKLNQANNITSQGDVGWSIHSLISKGFEENEIGTGLLNKFDNKRIIKINSEKIKKQSELVEAVSIMWLTPQMDGIFINSSSDRRKFLDRLVYNFDPEHASRVYSYEYYMRDRLKLLQSNNYDNTWLDLLENKMAEKAVAIAIARNDTIGYIQSSIDSFDSPFPKAIIGVKGNVENIVNDKTSLDAENFLKESLYSNRQKDSISGRTNIGTHKSDLFAVHQEKNIDSSLCSTGEQKALLLSIILAEARAKTIWKSLTPIILLDEIVSHLDEKRRDFLFDFLLDINAQTWMTGTSEHIFSKLKDSANFFKIDNGNINSC